MSNGSARLIGAVGLILAGAVMYGLGLVAYSTGNSYLSVADRCANVGIGFVVVGSLLFVTEYANSWFSNEGRKDE